MSKKIVIDTSIVVSILFKDEENKYSKSFLKCIADGMQLIVPGVFYAEILNILAASEKNGRLDSDDIQEILQFLLNLKILTVYSLDKRNVLKLAKKHGITAYDAIYLSLAKIEKLQLATLDEKLKQACVAEGIFWNDPKLPDSKK